MTDSVKAVRAQLRERASHQCLSEYLYNHIDVETERKLVKNGEGAGR